MTEINKLNIGDFDGFDATQRDVAAPPVSAVYSWVFDFEALTGRTEERIHDALLRFTRLQGRMIDSQNRDHFTKLTWHARRPAMRPERINTFASLLAGGGDTATLAAKMATFNQRPVYVGETDDLSRRIAEHLNGETNLMAHLGQVPVADLAVVWLPVDLNQEAGEDEDSFLNRRTAVRRSIESLVIRSASPLINERTDF